MDFALSVPNEKEHKQHGKYSFNSFTDLHLFQTLHDLIIFQQQQQQQQL